VRVDKKQNRIICTPYNALQGLVGFYGMAFSETEIQGTKVPK
jgi:hypothetical protein